MNPPSRVLLAALLAASVGPAVAAPLAYKLPEETAALKPGPGDETAVICLACHSADYTSTQPPGKGRPFWEAEVQKMIKVFQAPISSGDAAVIVDYLAAAYP
ncbi:sulfite dehydrogenase (cytochrome) subunit SorB [Roseiarcus fermentans]|uniref:Sulfite dehydrogenase (Cytochrome) subunit SorB n=1 Tax=Roseiarcus fermentans TaxID=1473586 RepID=A0A366FS79_9HYPH|nr:cytochrome c [Roseiarcus fermentans]RBP17544.1 sulfite dehydrogenase (cytochrome) subunit SorB [Roseiarcus fermentans]